MKRVAPYLAVAMLAISVIIADKFYPYGPSSDEDEIYLAQNFQYVNPHISFDGTYVPGYYRPEGDFRGARNPTPDYFPVGKYQIPYSGNLDGAKYFSQTTGGMPSPGGIYEPPANPN